MLYNQANAVNNSITGRFEESHQACNETVERDVREGKNFIGVVSTVSLILEHLPTMPKAQRASIIKAHLETTHRTGATLPDNLRTYLAGEHQKATKRPVRKPRKRPRKVLELESIWCGACVLGARIPSHAAMLLCGILG